MKKRKNSFFCCSTMGPGIDTAAELRSPARGPAAPQGAPPAQRCAAAAPGHVRQCLCGRGGPPAAAGRERSPRPHCPAPAQPRCSKACLCAMCAMCWKLLTHEASTAAGTATWLLQATHAEHCLTCGHWPDSGAGAGSQGARCTTRQIPWLTEHPPDPAQSSRTSERGSAGTRDIQLCSRWLRT